MSKVAGGSTSSPKTFQCTGYPGCNMVFTRSEHLARHERKHTGEKPYKCIVPSCPRTFSRFDNMMQHTQTHGDRPKRDSLVATTTGAARSRSSSMQTTSVINGRPRGGSSPGIFGLGYDDPHHRNLQSSPASHMNNPVFSQQQQHHHPYSPHHQQPQHHQHSTQWGFVGTSTPGSSALMTSQNNTDIHGGGSQPYLPNPMPIIRTLKANSRSLPHLQPRSSHSNSTDNFGTSLQHSFTGNETEELRRRKSEVLLPSFSYSGARAAAGYNSSHDVGLGMSSFPSKSEHSHTLPRVENLIPLEQDRLNEHRRTAHAMLHGVNASAGTRDKRVTPDYLDQNLIAVGHSTPQDGTNRSGSINSSLPQTHHLSTSEKDHLGHRKSPPESIYDGRVSKRSSNDPTDMVIQPLPSRDSRSGMQWFSQVNTPNNSSTELVPSMPHESQGPALASSQGKSGESSDSVNILPPILGHHDRYDEDTEKWDDRQSRPRSHSSHIHPLSRPSLSQFEPFGPSLWLPGNESAKDRIQFDPSLSPRLERHLEERFYPIRKAEVLDVIERMDAREFLGLKAQVAESFANDQFRNPEFLSNMTAVLCVIRAPHPAWKNPDTERKSSSGYHRSDELIYAHSHKDMDVDRPEDNKRDDSTGDGESMDVDGRRTPVFNQEHAADRKIPNVEQPCRYALDIDMDSFGCDPEPSLRALEGLTINSLFPTKSFVAGFEPVLNTQNQGESEDRNNTSEDDAHRSLRGYPSNARIGRFYLPERAFRTPESLAVQSDPKGSWICCQFEEYRGISIWVLESVLEKYHELARKHKMALTLVGAPVHHHVATYDHDEWEVHAGELYDVKVKESMLFPDMIQQVWKDIHRQYYQQHQNHHPQHLQPPPPPRQSFIQHQGNHPPTSSHTLPSHASNQIITYEEYQKSLLSGDPQRESYSHLYSQSHVESGTGPDNYSDHRQQQQTIHREDLSSVPSSPNSPRQDDFQEDNQTHESTTSTPQQRDLLLVAGANMHRRISIAELCNPMRSLATERERYSRNEDS
ncbi:hypothetical protein BGZ49_009374 [Haplosporangium sp. Z 27]|nr:hypothetical protein BGZ49_009374 [Haplosporangium sp. Z 27]